jgi:PIN like domain
VRFFLDNNLSQRVARALHCLVEPRHTVIHLKDRFPPATPDVDWMNALAAESDWIILSADVAISRNPHEVEAWKRAGHPIFFFKHSWFQQNFWEQASRLFHLFPDILKRAEKARKGDAFLVPFKGKIEEP